MSFSPTVTHPFATTENHLLAGRTVLQIIPELEAGGAERTTVDIAAGLTAVGARALVATEGGRLVAELQAKGGIWLPFPAATKNPFAMALNARRLALLCRREAVDLVHARSRAPAWVALAACRMARLPFVTTYHGSYNGRSAVKNSYNSVMARGDVVIANSGYTGELIVARHPFARERIRVVHRGTDFSAFAPGQVGPERVQALRAAWGVAGHQRIVLLPGRLTGWKGQRVLIDAAAILRDRGDADMPAALLAASVVAVPSTEPEAFGRVAVEAQAMGAPVVVSDLGAVPETVLSPPQVAASERTGWRVPADDAAALADGLAEALGLRPSARENLSRRAAAHVERHFSLEAMVTSTLDVYCALLETRHM